MHVLVCVLKDTVVSKCMYTCKAASPKVGRLYRELEGFFRAFFEEAAGCLHVDMSVNVSGALLRLSRVSLIAHPELSLVKLHLWQRHGGGVEVAYEVGAGGLHE